MKLLAKKKSKQKMLTFINSVLNCRTWLVSFGFVATSVRNGPLWIVSLHTQSFFDIYLMNVCSMCLPKNMQNFDEQWWASVKLRNHKKAGTKTKKRTSSFLEITTEMGNVRPQTFMSVTSIDRHLHQLYSIDINIYTLCIRCSYEHNFTMLFQWYPLIN